MGYVLQPNNLFINGKIIQYKSGESVLIREKLKASDFKNISYYPVTSGSELSIISYKSYNGKVPDASKLWWLIADVNDIFNPFDLSEFEGKDLIIPDIYELKLLIKKK